MYAIDILKTSFTKPHYTAEYARRRGAHAALAPYAAPHEVLRDLAEHSPLSYKERDAIVLALIAEHQHGGKHAHPLWQSLLLATYAGMIGNVRRRTLGGEREDNEQCALLAFLEAVQNIAVDYPPALLSLHLRHATERGAFQRAGRHDEPEMVGMENAKTIVDPSDMLGPIERRQQMRAIAKELRALFGDDDVAREAMDVLIEARTGREPLEEYVDATYPTLTGGERDAAYARLQRMRARALARLEKRFGRGFADRALRVA